MLGTMRPRWGLAIVASLASLVSCRALVSLDGLDDEPPIVKNDGGADGASSETGSDDGGGTDGSQLDAADLPAKPVVRLGDMNAGLVSVSVEGQYQIDFTQGGLWLPTRWFDLFHSQMDNLASSARRLSTPWVIRYFGSWREPEDGTDQYLQFGEQNDVRVQIDTHYHQLPPGDAGFDASAHLSLEGHYWFYASGRVIASQRISNAVGSTATLSDAEYAHTDLASSFVDAGVYASGQAFAFARTGGPSPASTLVLVNLSGDTSLGSNDATNRHWSTGALSIPDQVDETRTWEMQLTARGVDASEIAERADDAMNPGIQTVEGCRLLNGGYEVTQGAYHLDATGPRVRALLTSDRPRFSPAIIVESWTAATWTVKLGSAVLATSAQPRMPKGIATHDPSSQRLLFVYLGTIPRSASDPDRTFSVE
jgi:hypothetical protein